MVEEEEELGVYLEDCGGGEGVLIFRVEAPPGLGCGEGGVPVKEAGLCPAGEGLARRRTGGNALTEVLPGLFCFTSLAATVLILSSVFRTALSNSNIM